jgi:hypothetical protein
MRDVKSMLPPCGWLIAIIAASPVYGMECLSYVGETTLEGQLVRKKFPGPPNCESITVEGRREIFWLIKLDQPVCVDKDPADQDGLNDAIKAVEEVQLVLTAEQYGKYADRIGHHVTVSGTLFRAISGHHHTPLLMEIIGFVR